MTHEPEESQMPKGLVPSDEEDAVELKFEDLEDALGDIAAEEDDKGGN